jgi:hypothetical protein
MVITHEAIQKYIHVYTSILSIYAIYTILNGWVTFETISIYQQSRMSVLKYHFSAILNRDF